MKPIEQHLADYALGLARREGWRRHVKQCLTLWEQEYGRHVAERVRALINEGMKERAK